MPRRAAQSGACPQAYTPQRGRTPLPQPAFLPTTAREMRELGWDRLDVLLVSGDAYVDHPTFAMALLGRWLVAHGFRTGIVAQPRWDIPDDVARMGRPRLFTGISAGSLDSMLAHYTAFRKKRHDDAFTPGGRAGARPNRAAIVYANLARQAFPGLPVVLGGIEASLRRISHYDFWTDALRRPILMDAKADLLVWGMGERALLDATCALDNALEAVGADSYDAALLPPLAEIFDAIPGTARMGRAAEWGVAPADDAAHGAGDAPDDDARNDERTDFDGQNGNDQGVAGDGGPNATPLMRLPSHAAIAADPRLLMRATLLLERHVHRGDARAIQPVDDTPASRAVLLAPPAPPLSPDEMDALYALPFARRAHPSHREPVPAEEMIRTSITTHRGCGGGCSFCSLALHQGRRIASRSRDSVLDEARRLNDMERFNGSVSDVGGPSANMWQARCTLDPARCRRASCMHPRVCPGFAVDQSEAVELLRAVRATPGVRHVRVASGVRFDLALRDADALRAYTMEFTGGQLKVAPEHICDSVLDLMRKPGLAVFERFLTAFADHSTTAGKEQYVVPYLLSAFPGCTDNDMRTLSRWLAARGWSPRQVQCFIPTPGTVATAMFFAGIDPAGNPVPVARTDAARLRQHRILIPDFGLPPGAGGRQTDGPGHRPGGKAGGRPNEKSAVHDRQERQGRQAGGNDAGRERRDHGQKPGGNPGGRSGWPDGPDNDARNANRHGARSDRRDEGRDEGRNEGRNAPRPDSRPGSRPGSGPGSRNDRRGSKGGGGRTR